MGKITVKHYLNTNLKAEKIDGKDYYPIYLLVTARGRNTKIKSQDYSEVYTEADFKSLKANKSLDEETITIENIVTALLVINDDEFDTVLFAVLQNSFRKYALYEYPRTLSEATSYKFTINDVTPDIIERGYSFYDWYKPEIQKKLIKALNKRKINHRFTVNKINAAIVYSFFEVLKAVPTSNARFKNILTRYKHVIQNHRSLAKALIGKQFKETDFQQ